MIKGTHQWRSNSPVVILIDFVIKEWIFGILDQIKNTNCKTNAEFGHILARIAGSMPYFLLIFLLFYQLQKNNAEVVTTTAPSTIQTAAEVTGSSISTTTKGTQCLVPLTGIPGWLTLISIFYEDLYEISPTRTNWSANAYGA
uniref:Uncharacterized protein n=1 Tax=Onchocerca volvulus TaxID=6282 RepID=A0A8R1TTG1_ONCVO